jgi:serine-type D-Ala-D-Ala carboxypeptidase/endopeptidase (penicillin-binding protein 4)
VRLERLDALVGDGRAGSPLRLRSGQASPAPTVLVSRNADRLVLPASNMKVVTLAAAATRLGWDYRFRTRIHATGSRVGHVQHGDLVVIGSADPTIGRGDEPLATFRAWARQLRAQGLRRIEGDLVGDPSRFGEEWLGDSWSWDDLPAGYAAPYSGLIFNENVVRVRVAPGASEGEPVVVTASPVAYGLHLNPTARTAAPGRAATVRVTRALGSSVLDITGTMPIGAPPVDRTVSVSDPPRYFLGALRAALAEAGVDVRGRTLVAARPDVDGTAPLLVHESAPLSDIAQRFMKVSQNLYGEVLLRALSATSAPASPADARTALQQTLATIGVPTGSVQGLDGSGLSRRDFVTARAVTTLLHAMAQPPHREPFRATLPIAGIDGTIANRFKGSPCAGRLLAKTGTLSHARALSGYITTASGTEYVFSVIANNFLAPTRDIDTIVEEALALVCAS